MKRWLFLLALMAGLGHSPAAQALVCNSTGTGLNWATAATWTCGRVPLNVDDVTILAGHTITMNGNPGAALSLTISGTASWAQPRTTNVGAGGVTINAGGNIAGAANGVLTSTGGLTINTVTTSTTVTVTLQTTAGQTITGTGSLGRLAINATATNNGTLTVTTVLSGTSNLTNTGTLNIGGTSTITTLTANAVGNTVNYNGAGNQTIKLPAGGNYHHLTASGGGTKSPAAGTYNIAGNLTINAGPIFSANTSDPTINVTGNVTVDGTYAASNLATRPLTIGGNLALTGTFTGNAAPVNLAGNFTDSGSFTSGAGVFTFNGSAAQTLDGTATNTTFTNLTMNNNAAFANRTLMINHDITVNTLLTFNAAAGTGGRIVTSGTAKVVIPSTGNITNASGSATESDFIAGRLQRFVAAGASTVAFPVGSDGAALPAAGYTPASLSFTGVAAGGGSLIVYVGTPLGDHPNIATSGLDSAKSVNRWWALTTSGATGTPLPAFTNYSATFTFIPGVTPAGDLDSGANTANFEIERWDGAAWNTTTVGTRTATTTQATGVTALGEFAVAEKKPAVVTPGSFNAFETSTAAGAVTGVIKTKIAGVAFSLDVVAISGGVQLAGFTDPVIVELLGNTTTGVPLDVNNCPTTFTLVQTVTPNPTITGGRSTVSFAAVPDVWRDVRVRIRWPTVSPTVTSCSTDNFAIRPSSITVTVTDATWTTPGGIRTLNNTAVSGGTVHRAGQPFRVTASALPGTATQYDGSPTVKTATCLLLGTMTACANGTFTLPGGAWSGAGTRTNDSATYSEVGALTLELEDQSFASVDAADSTLAERTVPQAGGTIQVGRFVPDHFIVAPDGGAPAPAFQTFGAACAATRSFTYIGQPFGFMVPPQALVTARNAAGGTTTNYRESLWKISTAAPSDVTQTYSNNAVGPAIDTSLATNAPTVAPLNDGTGTVTVSLLDRIFYTRSPTTPVAPFNANISLTITMRDDSEADGQITTTTATPFSTIAFDSGNEFRYGRLRLGNANGSQLVPLPVRMEAQYWGFTNPPTNTVLGFITNTADNCTTLTGTNITMGNFQGNLGPLASCKTNMNANITFTAGRGNLQLTAPGSANNGSVDLTVQLGTGAFGSTSCVTPGSPPPQATSGANRAYLQGNWTGVNFDQNPTGRASFGLYKGAEEVIFIRENF